MFDFRGHGPSRTYDRKELMKKFKEQYNSDVYFVEAFKNMILHVLQRGCQAVKVATANSIIERQRPHYLIVSN